MENIDMNYTFFKTALPGILKDHRGDYVVVHDCTLVDFYHDREKALEESARKYGLGNFIVQLVDEDEDSPKFVSNWIAFA